MSTSLFDARYPGRCDANGCRIEEGDRIGYADGYDKPLCEPCWCLSQSLVFAGTRETRALAEAALDFYGTNGSLQVVEGHGDPLTHIEHEVRLVSGWVRKDNTNE